MMRAESGGVLKVSSHLRREEIKSIEVSWTRELRTEFKSRFCCSQGGWFSLSRLVFSLCNVE